jgi:ABC-type nitrate/sulfonate/bicarbonate transport system ATPase subunit
MLQMGQIQIQNLKKDFRNRRRQRRPSDDPGLAFGDCIEVLRAVNLDFPCGEMVCILGPSGCGKSTLLKIIAGFEMPTAGAVRIDGVPVTGPSSSHIFVFQHSGLLPWMTVRQNVAMGLRRLPEVRLREEKIQEYVDMVELAGFEDHYPYQLSGGMQRRAELARALAVNPDVLIMDEPFSGLDFLTHMKMREEVVNMHEFIGKTILVVTHDIDDALIMGDRIVVMSGRPSEVKLERKLDFPHPRNYDNEPELSRLRDEVFLMLGVSYAV